MARTRNKYHYAIRKVKKSQDLIRAKALFEASQVSSVNLIEELKKVRGGGKSSLELPDNVGGANGEDKHRAMV